ncbi:MAG TPA: sensor histidine kinase [Roseiflexaceae bacterium]|nr:sensor histidine kinase [Roseiflexaceae bacterium]
MTQTSRHTPQTPAWVLDLLLGVAVTLVIALVISAQQGGRQPADALAYLFAAVFGALMMLRRRFPVAVMVATMLLLFTYYTLGYPAIGLAVPVVAAMYSAAERGRLRAAIVVSLILIAVSTYYRLRDGESVAYLLGYDLVSTVALLAATIALGDSTRTRRDLRAEQANIARLIEQEQIFRAEQRLQAERMRIARDLHDTVGHSISVISLHADVAREALGRNDDDVRRALGHVRAASSELMRELRATVKVLRAPADAPPVQPAGSLAQLPTLVEQTGMSGLRLEICRSGDDRPLPAGIDAAAYRIVQEAVTNVLRHADATQALICIAVEARELRLEIADNGGAARGVVHWGAGLAGMAERAQACGGTLAAGPTPSGGFVVRATLPLGDER